MKIFLCALCVLCGATSAFARVGDLEPAINQQLGQPIKKSWCYSWFRRGPFRVMAMFEDVQGQRVCVMEVWSRTDREEMKPWEIEKLTRDNAAGPAADKNPRWAVMTDDHLTLILTTRRWLVPKGESIYTGS
jgi:hypothetical protein